MGCAAVVETVVGLTAIIEALGPGVAELERVSDTCSWWRSPHTLHYPHPDDLWYLLNYGLIIDYLLFRLWTIKLILILSWYLAGGIKRIDILD